MTRRRIFIGDIQGCADELDRLLGELDFEPGTDRLYAVGDLINRGPHSSRVVRTLHKLGATVVVGNHEGHYFSCLKGQRIPKGRDTINELWNAPDRDELTEWLRTRPVMHVEPDLVMVHAGIHPLWEDLEAIARQLDAFWNEFTTEPNIALDPALRFALTARRCTREGVLEQDVLQGSETLPWDDLYRGPRTVVFGHWAQRGLTLTPLVKGLDTGCVYGGKLTAWIAEEDRIVQVEASRAYCPIE